MALYVVTFTGPNGRFDMDYHGIDEEAVRGMAAEDWPDFTVANVKVA
jgi:hypothetical protein